jgi:hypothetical protein
VPGHLAAHHALTVTVRGASGPGTPAVVIVAGVADCQVLGPLALSLLVAFLVTVPVNRWMIGRGKGHAVVHPYHHWPAGLGSPPREVRSTAESQAHLQDVHEPLQTPQLSLVLRVGVGVP